MTVAFDDYLLDWNRRELTRGSVPVTVGPQVFDLLVYLVQNRDRVVSKDDLIDVVWGGRIVSESTLTSHINAVRRAIGDSGEGQRLVRTIARKGYRFVGETRDVGAGHDADPVRRDAHAPVLSLPDRPSIAVLPFLNLSGDPEQEYFSDGITEDIIVALSRFHWLFVIARNSSFTYKGRIVDEKRVGRELGVRYVLGGSIRKAGDRVRITGQLMDATTGMNIWSDRFEGVIDDIFELQDQMTANVVSAISPRLERAEIDRVRHKPTRDLTAYEYYLRAMANVHIGSRAATDDALRHLYDAIDLDPDYAAAHAMAAWCHLWRKIHGWMIERDRELAEGTRLARRAVELGSNDAVALARAGSALSHLAGDLDTSLALLDRAKMLNPNLASAWFLGGFVRIWRGTPEDAIKHLTQAMQLSPLDPEMYRMQVGMAAAHLFAKRFDEASLWAAKSFRALPTFGMAVAIVCASHALAGRSNEAKKAMLKLRQLDPSLRISKLSEYVPIRRPEDLALLSEGLQEAGLPA